MADLSLPTTKEEIIEFVSTLKIQELGLNILLIKIINNEAERLKKLESARVALENDIFDENIFESLTPSEKIQRYQLALQSIQSSTAIVSSSSKEISWGDIETRLQILTTDIDADNVIENPELRTSALKLLQQLGKEK